MNPEEGTVCSVEDCENDGLIAQSKLVDFMTVWVVWCGQHMIERKQQLAIGNLWLDPSK